MVKEFKQTEIGEIPNSWSLLRVGDEFNFKNGLNKEKKFFGFGIPIVNYLDVFSKTGIKANDIKGRVFLNAQEIKNYNVQKGDVLFTRTSETVEEIGISSVILEDLINTVFSGFVLRARPINKVLDEEFCRYCFSSAIVRKQILATASYTTRALTNGRLLSDIQIPFPPTKTEQTVIATALNDADALITSLEKLIAKKKAIKQGAMQALFRPRSGWEEGFLTEYVDYIHGKAHEKYIDENGKYVVVNSKFISSDGMVAKFSNKNFCPARKDDILTVLSDLPNGKALAKCFYVEENKKFAVNQRICIWRSKGTSSKFLYYILNRNKYFLGLDDGISQTHILNHHIEKCRISVPKDYNEQLHIAQILSDMDAEIEALESKLEKQKLIKQGMMQNLLTGKIRLV